MREGFDSAARRNREEMAIFEVSSRADVLVASCLSRRFALRHGFDPRCATELGIAVSELATNAVVHGGGWGKVSLTCADGGLRMEVEDRGRSAGGARPPVERRGLGCGREAVERLLDCVQSESKTGGGLRCFGYKRRRP